MSGKIAVVTDSTAYIPEQALGAFDIPVIPLWLIWGDERFSPQRGSLSISSSKQGRGLRPSSVC
jgi:fatty acid-binding protein DegV